MNKAVVVSFEDNIIRVVYAKINKDNKIIDDVLVLRDNELDEFLLKEKTKSFIVVNKFKEFFQDIILLPRTKKNILRKLIKEETKKRSAFHDFSFIFNILGEKLVENINMLEVFVFAVKNEEIKMIADRFIQKGKIIKALYPDLFTLASQIESDETFLCVSGTGFNKTLFLFDNKAINFVRPIQSFQDGLHDLDIQNINMTVNYCRQTMKINPSHVLLFGSLCNSYETSLFSSIPVLCFPYKSGTFLDFATPISALYAGRDINILSDDYRIFYNLRMFLQYTTIVFVLLSFIGLGYAGYLLLDVITKKEKLEAFRKDISDIESVLSSYEDKKTLLAGYTPFINDLREIESYPDIQKLMILISGLKTDRIVFASMFITKDANGFKLDLRGEVEAQTYADMQGIYEKFIKSIDRKSAEHQKIKLKSHSLELKNKSFTVEMEYR